MRLFRCLLHLGPHCRVLRYPAAPPRRPTFHGRNLNTLKGEYDRSSPDLQLTPRVYQFCRTFSPSPRPSPPLHLRGRHLNVLSTLRGAYDGLRGIVQLLTAYQSKSSLGLCRTAQRPRERSFRVCTLYTYRICFADACHRTYSPRAAFMTSGGPLPPSPPSELPLHFPEATIPCTCFVNRLHTLR